MLKLYDSFPRDEHKEFDNNDVNSVVRAEPNIPERHFDAGEPQSHLVLHSTVSNTPVPFEQCSKYVYCMEMFLNLYTIVSSVPPE